MKWKLTFVAILMALPAQAQQFTTAAEIRPILDATKSSWVAVREFDGRDLLYFTHLMAWRCGLDAVYYSVNNGDESLWDGEPCYEDGPQPNAQKGEGFLPFTYFDLQSIKSVQVRLVYDDGAEDSVSFERGAIMTP